MVLDIIWKKGKPEKGLLILIQ